MFNIGDLIIYSAHGICKIDDICEKTFSGMTRTYYVLHPVEDQHQSTISIPVDNEKVIMLEMMHKDEADEILESFKYPGMKWNEKPNIRYHSFSEIVNSGNRKKIAKLVNTLMRKKLEAEAHEKKLYEQDRKILVSTQNILFNELAVSLNTTFEDINKKAIRLLNETTKIS